MKKSKTKKAVAAPKAAKAKVAPKAAAIPTPQTITLLRMPKDGELRAGQALTILEILERKGGTLPLPELLKAMEAKIVHQNILGIRDVFYMNRPRLLEGGFIEVKKS
jgi:hypothetical protein